MGFFSFLNRVLFVSLFILSVWQSFNDFGVDYGPAAKELVPQFTFFKQNLSSKFGVALPDIDARQLVATIIALKGLGGIVFVFGSSFEAYINYSPNKTKFSVLLDGFLQNTSLFGTLLFFIGMKNLIRNRQLRKKAPKNKRLLL